MAHQAGITNFMKDGAVYKIFTQSEWHAFEASGSFAGSSDDKRDGFIHLSSKAQVPSTLAHHYAAADHLMLARVDFGKDSQKYLKWEISHSGDRFPHFYGILARSDITAFSEIMREMDAPWTVSKTAFGDIIR